MAQSANQKKGINQMKLKELTNQLKEKELEIIQLKKKMFRDIQFADQSAIAYPGNRYICIKLCINQYEVSISFKKIESITIDSIKFDVTFFDYDSIRIYDKDDNDVTDQLIESKIIPNPEGMIKTSHTLIELINHIRLRTENL